MALIVQKYGGATLATPEKIKQVSSRIQEQHQNGTQLVAIVSAMGKTTNQLIDLAHQVANNPTRRELDMLLTTGERVSMALVSMALNDLGCPAISFTGSQAGILTDQSHVNAFIQDVKAFRVQEELKNNKVVILAGFQGVSPLTKEITTLGRGGSDTTAVAVAAYLNADRCEILKDVPGVFTADPNICKSAQPIQHLNYDQMMEMTFWGAKVLHYRSVELAKTKNVLLYIGPASQNTNAGTLVTAKGPTMYESCQILSLNSHEQVLKLTIEKSEASEALKTFDLFLTKNEIAHPQILEIESNTIQTHLLLTGPAEILTAIESSLKSQTEIQLQNQARSTVTATCTGITSPEITQKMLSQLKNKNIPVEKVMISAMSATFVLDKKNRAEAIHSLHELIQK